MHRQERIQHQIAETIGELIVGRQIKDPRVNPLASVSRVIVARDFSRARIFISGYMDDKALERSVAGLNSAAGFIQGRLGKVLNTRQTPRVLFVADTSIAEGFDIIQKLSDT
ncbi:30S ribosome-binding factor RbfA [Spirochaeta africana]|uniref:Ribosome-binding factor A n=1 Tax=Spirochaeta africana (strain ATCC 700263 / DSM 8902 / Z-7692) TaxID=889378 RepID=H9UJA5_SPIAZ|nr:30S ribosome-binding factor RbfA [Spirochaeta africana]AFG37598.1 ribosome-binding factor A [Spirochaeta africana DSM 8902]